MKLSHHLPGILGAALLTASLTFPAFAMEAVKSGAFEGGSGHSTAGAVSIIEKDGKYLIHLGDDFVQDGTAPDATVALGQDGYDETTNLGKLRSFTGAQDYELPAGIDPAKFNEVYIWCKKFSVPLGVASIK